MVGIIHTEEDSAMSWAPVSHSPNGFASISEPLNLRPDSLMFCWPGRKDVVGIGRSKALLLIVDCDNGKRSVTNMAETLVNLAMAYFPILHGVSVDQITVVECDSCGEFDEIAVIKEVDNLKAKFRPLGQRTFDDFLRLCSADAYEIQSSDIDKVKKMLKSGLAKE